MTANVLHDNVLYVDTVAILNACTRTPSKKLYNSDTVAFACAGASHPAPIMEAVLPMLERLLSLYEKDPLANYSKLSMKEIPLGLDAVTIAITKRATYMVTADTKQNKTEISPIENHTNFSTGDGGYMWLAGLIGGYDINKVAACAVSIDAATGTKVISFSRTELKEFE